MCCRPATTRNSLHYTAVVVRTEAAFHPASDLVFDCSDNLRRGCFRSPTVSQSFRTSRYSLSPRGAVAGAICKCSFPHGAQQTRRRRVCMLDPFRKKKNIKHTTYKKPLVSRRICYTGKGTNVRATELATPIYQIRPTLRTFIVFDMAITHHTQEKASESCVGARKGLSFSPGRRVILLLKIRYIVPLCSYQSNITVLGASFIHRLLHTIAPRTSKQLRLRPFTRTQCATFFI